MSTSPRQEVQNMEENSMTATETMRLADWLTAHGLSAQDALDCIKYIATGTSTEDAQSATNDPSEAK